MKLLLEKSLLELSQSSDGDVVVTADRTLVKFDLNRVLTLLKPVSGEKLTEPALYEVGLVQRRPKHYEWQS